MRLHHYYPPSIIPIYDIPIPIPSTIVAYTIHRTHLTSGACSSVPLRRHTFWQVKKISINNTTPSPYHLDPPYRLHTPLHHHLGVFRGRITIIINLHRVRRFSPSLIHRTSAYIRQFIQFTGKNENK